MKPKYNPCRPYVRPSSLFTAALARCTVRVVHEGKELGRFSDESSARRYVRVVGVGTVEPVRKAG